MGQLFGNFVPEAAIGNVRHKIANLEQDIKGTDPERYKLNDLKPTQSCLSSVQL